MKKIEQLIQYDFHDSLLESISYNKEENKVKIEIDFCSWKQEGYDEKDEETAIISLIFENVSKVSIPSFTLNSDEIIELELLKSDEEVKGVKLIVFNDVKKCYYEIVINADDVVMIK